MAEARSAVRAWLARSEVVPASLHDELMLASTELFTDAVESGGPNPIILRAWTDEDYVVLEVEGGEPAEPGGPKVQSLWHGEAAELRMSLLRKVCDDFSRTSGGAPKMRCRKRMG